MTVVVEDKYYYENHTDIPMIYKRPITKAITWNYKGRAMPLSTATIETRTYTYVNMEARPALNEIWVNYRETTFGE